MKAQTLKNRIAKSNNKNGSTPKNNGYSVALQVITKGSGRTHYTTGSGRYTGIANCEAQVIEYLTAWGIDFEKGNDAPKGGQLGNFIALTKKGFNQLKDYHFELDQEAEKIRKEIEEEESKLPLKRANHISIIENNVASDFAWFQKQVYALNEARNKGAKDEWQVLANALVQKASKNDFTVLRWKEIYEVVREFVK